MKNNEAIVMAAVTRASPYDAYEIMKMVSERMKNDETIVLAVLGKCSDRDFCKTQVFEMASKRVQEMAHVRKAAGK